MPTIAGVEISVPIAEPAIGGTKGLDQLAGGTEAQVGDGVAPEVVAKGKNAAMTIGLLAVVLKAGPGAAEGEAVASAEVCQRYSAAITVLGAIDGYDGRRSDGGERIAGADGPVGGGGLEKGSETIKAERCVHGCAGGQGPVPGNAGGVGFGIGVGVLSGDELKSVDALGGEAVAERDTVFAADALIELSAGGVGIDVLGGNWC